jgi:predicted metal-dependent hydrolase
MPLYETKVRAGREMLAVKVEADSRLRKTARWMLRGDTISLRVPIHMNQSQIEQIIADIAPRIARQRKRARRQTDVNLMERAAALNETYFNGELSWHSIRWVNNMEHRLGSFTTGGSTDGDIRISERVRKWPDYVIDYVLAHEICHRIYPNHSQAFWDYLAQYPYVQKALGFIEGIAFAEGLDPADMMD